MDAFSHAVDGLRASPLNSPITFSLLFLLVSIIASCAFGFHKGDKEPWSLPDWKGIPVLGNTIQYIVDNESFITRSTLALQTRDICKFYLGPMKVYLIAGPQNVAHLFRKSPYISADKFNLMTMEALMCYTKDDLAKYAGDKTGRLAEPMEGMAESHQGPRYWYHMHHDMRNLSQISSTKKLTEKFVEFFEERVQVYPRGEPVEVNLYHFMRTRMAGAAITAFAGRKLFERFSEKEFLEAFWNYDSIVIRLLYALPKWMDPKPWRIRATGQQMCMEWLQKDFDPVLESRSDEYENQEWHPALGLRFLREYLGRYKEHGFSDQTRAGQFLGFMLGLNANSIPIAAWCLMEVIQNRALLKEIQAEAGTAFSVDPSTGKRVLDVQKMMGLQLLQSVYAEVLRLHVSVNITREVIGPTTIAGYELPKHSLVQAPTRIAHYNEGAWGKAGHPASEFWAYRHIKYTETKDENGNAIRKPEFVITAGPNDYFPYGGGVSICPGRHFAKQEILAAVAVIVTTFDIELVSWRSFDGKSNSDRPAREDPKYSGSAAMPPDRDMKVRWIRRV